MNLNKKLLAAAALAVCSTAGYADAGGGALDLTSGSTFFGRADATGIFTDTWTFTLAGMSSLTGTASSSAVDSQDLDFGSVFIATQADPATPVATFAGNLGTDMNEFYSLAQTPLAPGAYAVVVNGTNSPLKAAYSGTLTIAAAAVPEPGTYALMFAGLGIVAFIGLRRRRPR